MKHLIKQATLLDQFMTYHEDYDNYSKHINNFKKMYKVLDKYMKSPDENVSDAFERAPEDEQKYMVDLIRP